MDQLCEETHTLFYTKYNKESLSQFLNSIENVIILEYFLALVIYSIKNQVAEISTFGETIEDIKRDLAKKEGGNQTHSIMGQNSLVPGQLQDYFTPQIF